MSRQTVTLTLAALTALSSVTAVGCSHTVRAVDVSDTAESADAEFDLRAFVCELAGEPSPSGAMIDGQRYMQAERQMARLTISRELQRLGLRPQLHIYTNGRRVNYPHPERTPPLGDLVGANLFAELPATAGADDGVIVVGAHYDTVPTTPGADDNASGVAAVLLVARRLARLPVRHHAVIFAFFDQEEEWLVGSDRFAGLLVRDGRHVVTVHNVDMVGWDGDGDGMAMLLHGTYREPPLDSRYMDLYGRSLIADGFGRMPRGIIREDTNRGEHTSFEMRGFDAVTLMEETEAQGDFNPNYHSPADACGSLDYGFLRACANLVTAAVTEQLTR